MSHPVPEAITEVATEKFHGYEPQGPLEWLSFMHALPDMFQEFGDAFGNLGDKLASDYPSPEGVPDMWGDLTASLRGLVDHAQEMAQKFEQDPRVQRALNPQPNEPVMDVANDG